MLIGLALVTYSLLILYRLREQFFTVTRGIVVTLFITTVPPIPPFVPEQLSVRTGTTLDDDQRFYGNQFEAVVTLGEKVKNVPGMENLLFPKGVSP